LPPHNFGHALGAHLFVVSAEPTQRRTHHHLKRGVIVRVGWGAFTSAEGARLVYVDDFEVTHGLLSDVSVQRGVSGRRGWGSGNVGLRWGSAARSSERHRNPHPTDEHHSCEQNHGNVPHRVEEIVQPVNIVFMCGDHPVGVLISPRVSHESIPIVVRPKSERTSRVSTDPAAPRRVPASRSKPASRSSPPRFRGESHAFRGHPRISHSSE
jgi:hypothetical protein